MDTHSTSCAVCGSPITPAKRGRPRRFCSDRCRQSAHRGSVVIKLPQPRLTDDPPPRHSADDQVATALLEAETVMSALTVLARTASPNLRWRCERVATAMREALAEVLPQ